MDGYLYETHLHTSEASACGRVSGSDYIDFMIGRGFKGMAVTDHFFNGNSAVDRSLPWNEKVRLYAAGYRKALEAASGMDFDVIFGIEFNFNGDEYLIYGLDENWLVENERIMTMTRHEVYDLVRRSGGIMIQAHPFRERGYLSDIRLTPSVCDGIEIYNAANSANMNALAYRYARELDVRMTAGSDIHYFHDGSMGGMIFGKRIKDTGELAGALLSGEGIPVMVTGQDSISITPITDIPEQITPLEEPGLPVLRFE